jgi:hypothetical protein
VTLPHPEHVEEQALEVLSNPRDHDSEKQIAAQRVVWRNAAARRAEFKLVKGKPDCIVCDDNPIAACEFCLAIDR